jgi:hypothetical protein
MPHFNKPSRSRGTAETTDINSTKLLERYPRELFTPVAWAKGQLSPIVNAVVSAKKKKRLVTSN